MKAFLFSFVLLMSTVSFGNTTKQQMQAKEGTPTQLDDLIRGEMSAVKSYDQVMEKVTDAKEKEQLQSLRKNHVNALAVLKQYATQEIKEDTKTSGAWGTFTEAYTGGAKLFGNKTAMRALNQGEEHGVKEYEEALEDKNINPELKQKIRTELLPRQKEHVKTIKSYI